ncbi:hypothetical protein BDV59DRAFT_119968 [Aspergillus ambiguus]|uniref:putative GPI anchored protein n=1 Tax=Aspergillus ambiguus TaxID=176160 RepID=UPI003CCD641D
MALRAGKATSSGRDSPQLSSQRVSRADGVTIRNKITKELDRSNTFVYGEPAWHDGKCTIKLVKRPFYSSVHGLIAMVRPSSDTHRPKLNFCDAHTYSKGLVLGSDYYSMLYCTATEATICLGFYAYRHHPSRRGKRRNNTTGSYIRTADLSLSSTIYPESTQSIESEFIIILGCVCCTPNNHQSLISFKYLIHHARLPVLALSGLILMSNVAIGTKLDDDDIPNRCWKACGPVVGIARKCNGIYNDDDHAELQCICDWNKASTLIPLCEACIVDYGSSNGTDYGVDLNDNHDDRYDRDDRDLDHSRDNNDCDECNGRVEYTKRVNQSDHDRGHENGMYLCAFNSHRMKNKYLPGAYDILVSCSLSTTTYNAAAATSAMTSTVASPNATATETLSSTSSFKAASINTAPMVSIPKAASLAAVVDMGFVAWL